MSADSARDREFRDKVGATSTIPEFLAVISEYYPDAFSQASRIAAVEAEIKRSEEVLELVSTLGLEPELRGYWRGVRTMVDKIHSALH